MGTLGLKSSLGTLLIFLILDLGQLAKSLGKRRV